MGRIFSRLGVDSREVMELFCEDTSLNISTEVLAARVCVRRIVSSEGSPFAALSGPYRERRCSAALGRPGQQPVVNRRSRSTGSWPGEGHRVALLGLSFKPDSDDLRESPYVDLAETLLGKGYEVRIHDPVLNPSSLVGPTASTSSQGFLTSSASSPTARKRPSPAPTSQSCLHSTQRSSLRCSLRRHRGSSTSTVGSDRSSRRWTATKDSPGDADDRRQRGAITGVGSEGC